MAQAKINEFPKVILDTNVLYSHKLEHLLEINSTFDLIVTHTPLYELTTTNKISSKPRDLGRARKALQALINLSQGPFEAYFLRPFEYVEALMNPNTSTRSPQLEYRVMFKFAQQIANGGMLNAEQEVKYKEIVEKENDRFKAWADIFALTQKRDTEGVSLLEKDINSDDAIWNCKYEIAYFITIFTYPAAKENLNPHTNKKLHESMIDKIENYDWEKLELFLSVYLEFKKNLVQNGNRSVQINDFWDLWNMVYVQPGSLYWTGEKKWNELIENAGLGHYIFRE